MNPVAGERDPQDRTSRQQVGGVTMRTKLVVSVAVLIAIGGAYYAGDLPQRELRVAADSQVESLQETARATDARMRMSELLGHVLTLKEVAILQNYGQALAMATPFFDAVRTESMTAPEGPLRDGATYVMAQRDSVTAGLAKSDPFVVGTLHDIEIRLRVALGYEVPENPAVEPRPLAP